MKSPDFDRVTELLDQYNKSPFREDGHVSIEQGHLFMFDRPSWPVLESIPGKVSGAWVFRGTRVPVSAILKNLKHLNLNELVEEFQPS